MPEDAEQVKSINIGGKKYPRSWGIKHRLLTLEQLDRRTNAARRVHEIIDAIHLDLGGDDQLAVAERQIIQRAAVIGAMAEDVEARWLMGHAVDFTVLCTLANAQRRLFEAIGLKRRARNVSTPSVAEYLEHVANERADAA